MATTQTTNANPTVTITMNDRNNPPGKLADAELHFTGGLLAGTKLAQPPTCGTIVPVPHVGGLHHHYERRAA